MIKNKSVPFLAGFFESLSINRTVLADIKLLVTTYSPGFGL